MSTNSENPAKGAAFQKSVQEWFSLSRNENFISEKAIMIGVPPKPHKFDLSNENCSVVVECKCYTWTETGNVPSAKMGFCNEAVFYLRLLPTNCEKWLVMLKSYHPKRKETLAEYYYRTNKHLLGDVKIAEFDPEKHILSLVGQSEQLCVICGIGYTLDQLDQTTVEEFALYRMNRMPRKLYKYFPNTTSRKNGNDINHSLDALINNTVYLQSPNNFDDPYDSSIVIDEAEFHRQRLQHYLDICSIDYLPAENNNSLAFRLAEGIYQQCQSKKSLEEILKVSTALEETDKLQRSIFCQRIVSGLQAYQKDQDAWQHSIYDALNEELKFLNSLLMAKYKVSCFTSTPYSILMWAHYANSHKGFCVEYEIPDYCQEHAKLLDCLYPVIYSSRRKSVLEYCIRELDTDSSSMDTLWQIHKYGLLSKDIVWQYQNEWRLISYDKALSSDETYNCKFFKISKVYLGNKMPAEDRRIIIDLCKKLGIPYVGVKIELSQYTLSDCPHKCENCPNNLMS